MDTITINSDSSGGGDSALLESCSSMSVTTTENVESPVISNDLLEGTLYRTKVYESKICISFLSRFLFDMFLKKMHSDFRLNVEADETTFMSKCSTHIKGAKCDLSFDSHFKTVELSGVGFKMWREERFPKIAQSLFGRIMVEMDSQLEESSEREPLQENLSESCFQHDESYSVNTEGTPNEDNANSENGDHLQATIIQPSKQEVQPFEQEPVIQSSQSSGLVHELVQNNVIQKEFIAEKLVNGRTSTACRNNNDDMEKAVNNRNTQQEQGGAARNLRNLQGISRCENVTTGPIFTSTPIQQRRDGYNIENSGLTSVKICSLINKIDELDSGIKSIKKEILQKMERELNDLKVSVIKIENVGKKASYAESVRTTNNSTQQHQFRSSISSRSVDEGYGNLSDGSYDGDSSETQPKRLFTPVEEHGRAVTDALRSSSQSALHGSASPQPVPVRITNRNQQRTPPRTQHRTLLVGDSLMKGVNSKGLKTGVTVCAKAGATIKDIWNEVSVYNLNLYDNIVICVGGNDASKRTDTNQFEEKYDELLSFISSSNRDCRIHVCKVLPRGDVDVSGINASITRVSEHWKMHNVKCIDETYDFLFDKNGLPASRYYDADGVHLVHSGIRRLLDAINRHHLDIVEDFQACAIRSVRQTHIRNRQGQNEQRYKHHTVYGQTRINTENGQSYGSYRGKGPNTGNVKPRAHHRGSGLTHFGNGQSYRANRGNGRAENRQSNGKSGGRKLCFYCSMPGHFIADCWYAN